MKLREWKSFQDFSREEVSIISIISKTIGTIIKDQDDSLQAES